MGEASLKVITELQELEALRGIWAELVQGSDDCSIFLTYEWVSTWWLHFGENKKMHILLFEKNNKPVGIIPLMVTRYSVGPFAVKVLETIGAINDNRVWIVSPEYKHTVIETFLSYLRNELARLALIARLELVPEDSQFIKVLREKRSLNQDLLVGEEIATLAPYISLHQHNSWDDYFASLSANRRKILRRSTRRLAKIYNVKYGRFTFDSVSKGLETLFELHKKRWQTINIKSPFYDPQVRQFYHDLSARLLNKGWLHFSYISLDNEFASVIYSFVFNKKIFSAIYARDPTYSEYGVGHVHHMYAISEAITERFSEFDFLRGDEPHKFHWTHTFRRYLRVTLTRRRRLGLIRLKFLIAFIRLAEIIQHRHSLKEMYAIFKLERKEQRQKQKMGCLKKLK